MAHTERIHPPRVVSSIASMICMILLAILFGTRVHYFASLDKIKGTSLIRILVLLLTTVAIAFVAIAEVLEGAFDLGTIGSCRAAIYLCIMLYVGSKVLVQLFLVERVHVIKTHLHSRRQDRLWLLSIAILAVGFGIILTVALVNPIADFGGEHQVCSIGVPITVTIPLISYDILLNVALTGIFINLLRPLLAFRNRNSILLTPPLIDQSFNNSKIGLRTNASSNSRPLSNESLAGPTQIQPSTVIVSSRDGTNVEPLKQLIYKSLVGAVAILIPTVVNLSLLYRWRGGEQGWLCLTLCTVDGE
ncbi:hypothetical protein LTR95_011325 [Oleoguttula sp. CCFEE 5521]